MKQDAKFYEELNRKMHTVEYWREMNMRAVSRYDHAKK